MATRINHFIGTASITAIIIIEALIIGLLIQFLNWEGHFPNADFAILTYFLLIPGIVYVIVQRIIKIVRNKSPVAAIALLAVGVFIFRP